MEKPSKDMWVNWVRHPCTQFYLSGINTSREVLKEGISDGAAGSEVDRYIGRCMGIRDCLDYAIRDFEYAEKEKELSEEGEKDHES